MKYKLAILASLAVFIIALVLTGLSDGLGIYVILEALAGLLFFAIVVFFVVGGVAGLLGGRFAGGDVSKRLKDPRTCEFCKKGYLEETSRQHLSEQPGYKTVDRVKEILEDGRVARVERYKEQVHVIRRTDRVNYRCSNCFRPLERTITYDEE